jgi:hypothetical protein
MWIPSRHGDLSELSGYMGLIQAIISFFIDGDDSVQSLKAGDLRFVFLSREPLYLVCAAGTGESETEVIIMTLAYGDVLMGK